MMAQASLRSSIALSAARGDLNSYQPPVPLYGIFETATGAYSS
jgi:hypothetical protein